MTQQRLKQLEQKIRELVPESMDPSFGCLGIDKYGYTCRMTDQGWESNAAHGWAYGKPKVILGHPLTLEHCREAIKKHLPPSITPTNDAEHCLLSLHHYWKNLQPWESQTEVHEMLGCYLLPPES